MEVKFGLLTKKYMVSEVKNKLKQAPDLVMSRYKGLDASQIETLRKSLSKASSQYLVVKNAVLRRAFEELEMNELNKFVEGAVGVGITSDTIKAAKTFVDFAKKFDSFEITASYIDGKIESPDRIKYIATLPPKDVLRGMIASTLKSPIIGFVGVMSGLLRKFIIVISEIKNKKSEGGK